MNQNEFQRIAKQFRAGKLSLQELTRQVLGHSHQNQTRSDEIDDGTDGQSPFDPEVALKELSERKQDSHKGDFGRVLVIGGCRGMAGAPSLAGMSCLRSGAGLVSVAIPRSIQNVVAGFDPCLMTIGLPEIESGRISRASLPILQGHLEQADAVVLGPGLGRHPEINQLVQQLYRDCRAPMVVDADALNALASGESSGDTLLPTHAGPRTLTPHPGEFKRLTAGNTTGKNPRVHLPESISRGLRPDRVAMEQAAIELAQANEVVIVLKGHRTLVSDGSRLYRNHNGNPGMATAGSGDVLCGIIAAFLGQTLPPFDAAAAAVFAHGRSGDRAARKRSQCSMTASDIIANLEV